MVRRMTVLRRFAIRAIDAHQRSTIVAFLRAVQSVVRGAVYRTIKNTRHIHIIISTDTGRAESGARCCISHYQKYPSHSYNQLCLFHSSGRRYAYSYIYIATTLAHASTVMTVPIGSTT